LNLLQLAPGVGDQRAGIIFAARQRARDRDHPHFWIAERPEPPVRRGLKTVEAGLVKYLVLHAHQHDFGGIHHRAAADRDDQIGARVFRMLRRLHHHLARGVLRNPVEARRIAIAETLADFFNLIGLGVQRPADDQVDAPGVEAFGLLAQRLGRGLAVDDRFHRRILIDARGPHGQLPGS
jgi:hypothetical protein